MQETPQTNTPSTTPSVSATPTVNVWRKIAFLSLVPAIIIVPLWLTLGRLLFGVVGWYVFIMPLTVLPLALLYHITLRILAQYGTLKRTLPSSAAVLLGVYYLAVLIFEFAMLDFGDTANSVQSVFTTRGMPQFLNNIIYGAALITIIGTAIAILVVLINDVRKARAIKRLAQSQPVN